MLAQAIYQGKTKASLPKVPVPKGISCTQTENHWRSLETCKLFLKQIDEHMNPNGEQVPWMLVYDVDPVHVSKAFKVMRLEFPWIKFAYVDPGKTGTSQPLDRTYMYPMKRSMARAAAEHFSDQVLRCYNEDREIKCEFSGPRVISFVVDACIMLEHN